jgi:hypothetical protein
MYFLHILLCLTLLNLYALAAPGQQWNRYIPEKQRKDIIKKAIKVTGMSSAFSGRTAASTWVTDQVARAIISDAVDKERLTSEEAEVRYRALRPDGQYLILIGSFGMAPSPFGARNVKTVIHPSEAFLQRADDRQNFSKGEVTESASPFYLRSFPEGATFVTITFPRANRSNAPIIKDLNDKIEVQFVVSGRKTVMEYKMKDLAASLEEL